jgi:hypothetical protein
VKAKDNKLESSNAKPSWDVLVCCASVRFRCAAVLRSIMLLLPGSTRWLLSIRESTIGESSMISEHLLASIRSAKKQLYDTVLYLKALLPLANL